MPLSPIIIGQGENALSLPYALVIAPMAGVTDHPFRALCRKCGASLTVTEMVSAKALVYSKQKKKKSGPPSNTALLAATYRDEFPAAVQIFGSDPSCMAEAAGRALELSGADILDINMGCPMPKIVNNGDGSALMKDPDKAMKIVEAVRRAAGCPVTVKTRKGWDKGSVNAVEFAQAMESAGAAAVAIHARTKTQMYAGRADWDIIREVKQALSVPVVANGDVFEPEDVPHILRYTGADAAMVGRGSFGNPWLFAQGNAAIAGEPIPALPPLRERMEEALWQVEMAVQFKGEKIALLEARKQLSWYLRGVAHAGYYKQQIVAMNTLEEAREIVRGVQKDLR
jgi:nifR3 family TIM-barrel protein